MIALIAREPHGLWRLGCTNPNPYCCVLTLTLTVTLTLTLTLTCSRCRPVPQARAIGGGGVAAGEGRVALRRAAVGPGISERWGQALVRGRVRH